MQWKKGISGLLAIVLFAAAIVQATFGAAAIARAEQVGNAVVYEAENGSYGGGGALQSADQASGGKVIGALVQVGAYTSVQVDGGAGGTAGVVIRYANGFKDTKFVSLYVNGVKQQQVYFPPTGSWANFAETDPIVVSLNSGNNNTIKLQLDSTDYPTADIDAYTVTLYPAATYEAENGAFGGLGRIQDAGHASGGKVVGSLIDVGAYSEVTADGGEGGDATVVIRYANGFPNYKKRRPLLP